MQKLKLSLMLCSAALAWPLHSQVVDVTLSLDDNPLALSQTTLLHVYAQVVPEERANADRIFSWYVDLLNTNSAVVAPDYTALLKPDSDNDLRTSSAGFDDGPDRRGIYDTFMNRPGAGVSSAVELISVPVTALSPGLTRFHVQPGTGVTNLIYDFQVAPLGGGPALIGGEYGQAWIDLEVVASCQIQMQISRLPGFVPERYDLTFNLCPGYNHIVEFTEQLAPNDLWQPLPGAPHNSGSVTVTNTVAQRFFRIRAELP